MLSNERYEPLNQLVHGSEFRIHAQAGYDVPWLLYQTLRDAKKELAGLQGGTEVETWTDLRPVGGDDTLTKMKALRLTESRCQAASQICARVASRTNLSTELRAVSPTIVPAHPDVDLIGVEDAREGTVRSPLWGRLLPCGERRTVREESPTWRAVPSREGPSPWRLTTCSSRAFRLAHRSPFSCQAGASGCGSGTEPRGGSEDAAGRGGGGTGLEQMVMALEEGVKGVSDVREQVPAISHVGSTGRGGGDRRRVRSTPVPAQDLHRVRLA